MKPGSRGSRRWDGLALEEAVVNAGASCGLVRSDAEWSEHPQARALAELPLLEVLQIGDSAREVALGRTRRVRSPVCGSST